MNILRDVILIQIRKKMPLNRLMLKSLPLVFQDFIGKELFNLNNRLFSETPKGSSLLFPREATW